jgi:cytochrome c-type biogenesis protein CcmE
MAMGARKKRRIQLVALGTVMLVLASVLIGYGMRDGIEFFRSPSEIASHPPRAGERFRLGGLVEEGSLRKGAGHKVRFTVTDGGNEMTVVFAGILPDLFREGQGIIATGTMQGEVFLAKEVLAKHDESYMPKEVADSLKAEGLLRPGGGVDPKPGT